MEIRSIEWLAELSEVATFLNEKFENVRDPEEGMRILIVEARCPTCKDNLFINIDIIWVPDDVEGYRRALAGKVYCPNCAPYTIQLPHLIASIILYLFWNIQA